MTAASQAQRRPLPGLDKPLNGDAPQRAPFALDRRAATALDARRPASAAPTTAAGSSPDAVDALFAVRRGN